jgi:hypothetical protein
VPTGNERRDVLFVRGRARKVTTSGHGETTAVKIYMSYDVRETIAKMAVTEPVTIARPIRRWSRL